MQKGWAGSIEHMQCLMITGQFEKNEVKPWSSAPLTANKTPVLERHVKHYHPPECSLKGALEARPGPISATLTCI